MYVQQVNSLQQLVSIDRGIVTDFDTVDRLHRRKSFVNLLQFGIFVWRHVGFHKDRRKYDQGQSEYLQGSICLW
jgi:hypothetical protein